MSDQDDSRANAREEAERVVQNVIRCRESGMHNRDIAKELKLPFGRVQTIVGRLIRYDVVKPHRSRKGARQEILDYIDQTYGQKV